MKKLVMFFGLVVLAAGLLSAQTFYASQYDEITLSDFNAWRLAHAGEGTRRFRIPAFFSFKEDVTLSFIDANLETELSFESESLWPLLWSGQRVTVYFTTQGPWVWDRQLDAIDYGNGQLVQSGNIGSLAQDSVPPVGGTAAAAQPSAGQSGTGQSRTSVPATNPTTEEIASSREKPAEASSPAAAPSGSFNYGYAPAATTARPERITVQISGKAPQSGRYYRLQVGSFAVRGNATLASNKLRAFGLSPAFEEFENKVRVVLPRIPGDQVISIAERIGAAGFSEVWCREEF
jgi:hypothetical protein